MDFELISRTFARRSTYFFGDINIQTSQVMNIFSTLARRSTYFSGDITIPTSQVPTYDCGTDVCLCAFVAMLLTPSS